MFNKVKKQGMKDFKLNKYKKNINKSTSIKQDSKEVIIANIASCKHELKIQEQNGNKRMIGYKQEEIKDLENKLKWLLFWVPALFRLNLLVFQK